MMCSMTIICDRIGGVNMAKTKHSQSGIPNKKIVVVKGYRRVDGTKVKPHRRSTPD